MANLGLVMAGKQRQTQSLDIDIERTIGFWTDRITSLKGLMGAPSEWIKKLQHKHDDDRVVEKIVLKQEKVLLTEVMRIVNLLCNKHFICARNIKYPFSILEIGCGTGNLTYELAKFKRSHRHVSLTTGDISPIAIDYTKKKLIKNGYKHDANGIHQIIASSLTKKIRDPLITDQKIFDLKGDEFNLVIKGRIGHRLLGDAWRKSYHEVCKLLSHNGAILFYEPLVDVNNGNITDSEMREYRSTNEYHLLMKRLKMKMYIWNLVEVFDQTYVIGVFVKVSR
jgi:SAM-dependent methyltransferase